MNVYTYSEARRKLADVLAEAGRAGEVRIRRRSGEVFALRPVKEEEMSPFEAAGPPVKTRHPITPEGIVRAVRASRERGYAS